VAPLQHLAIMVAAGREACAHYLRAHITSALVAAFSIAGGAAVFGSGVLGPTLAAARALGGEGLSTCRRR